MGDPRVREPKKLQSQRSKLVSVLKNAEISEKAWKDKKEICTIEDKIYRKALPQPPGSTTPLVVEMEEGLGTELVSLSATPASMTGASKEAERMTLDWVPCIHYPV